MGMRIHGDAHVRVSKDNGPSISLNPRFDLHNHSPDGFNWGYNGAGPTQLALALMADALGDDSVAVLWYMDFRREVVAHFHDDDFTLPEEVIVEWMIQRLKDDLVSRRI